MACDHASMDKPNRAERRKNKFGGGRATEHGGWPTIQPNPVFEADGTEAAPEPQPKKASRAGKTAANAAPTPESGPTDSSAGADATAG